MTIQLGSKVRLKTDNGWTEPGCVMSSSGDRLHIYWPDENVFTDELMENVIPYMIEVACQPQEVAA